jgi:hypothetical protein
VTERPHTRSEEAEEEAAPQDAAPGQRPVREDSEKARGSASLLAMLFREAEIIARNLKESGTRR